MIVKEPPAKPPTVSCSEQVSDLELHRFTDLIYRLCGVRITSRKRLLLSNRLRRRLRQTGIDSFGRYFNHLRRLPADDPEWDALLQEVTTHETYLFRDEDQWSWFRGEFLPAQTARMKQGGRDNSLRIWSAACSTGDEAVSAACCIADALPDFQRRHIRLLATDIAVGALSEAARTTYGIRAMRLVPDEYRRRFFTKIAQIDREAWRLNPDVAGMIVFRRHNLLGQLNEAGFDLVMLKNVLIYFDAESKAEVVRNVRAALKPGGLLMTGAAEGVAHLLRDVKRLKPWLVRLPNE